MSFALFSVASWSLNICRRSLCHVAPRADITFASLKTKTTGNMTARAVGMVDIRMNTRNRATPKVDANLSQDNSLNRMSPHEPHQDYPDTWLSVALV